MNRKKLESMKGSELIAYADNLGVKLNCNKERTGLKESKSKAIDKIVAFEGEVDNTTLVSNNPINKESTSIDLDVESFCEKNQLTMHKATKKNTYYIKLNSKTLKLRVTKKNYICYKSGKYDNDTYEEKSNRTKYVFTSLNDILNIL